MSEPAVKEIAMVDVGELRELDAGATPGPWWVLSMTRVIGRGAIARVGHDGIDHSTGEALPDEQIEQDEAADAALIAATRNALPAILDRLERLEAVAEAARRLRSAARQSSAYDYRRTNAAWNDLRVALAQLDSEDDVR